MAVYRFEATYRLRQIDVDQNYEALLYKDINNSQTNVEWKI